MQRTDGATRRVETNARARPGQAKKAPFAHLIGRTRYVVLLAVGAVLLVSMALFVLGAWTALVSVWHAGQAMATGQPNTPDLTVEFLEVVSTMLKAVVFYIVGTGMYSLFIAPLNITAALGVESLSDLETKIISVVIVIMAVTLLEHFIRWEQAMDMLLFGVTMALVIAALVLFQWHTERAKLEQHDAGPDREEAQRELFEADQEERNLPTGAADGRGDTGRE